MPLSAPEDQLSTRVNMINLSTDSYPSPNGEFIFVRLQNVELFFPRMNDGGRKAVPCSGLGWGREVGRVIPGEKGIESATYQFCYGSSLLLGTEPQPLSLLVGKIDICSFHVGFPLDVC